jgi:apolipoprotein N-acyltransferase
VKEAGRDEPRGEGRRRFFLLTLAGAMLGCAFPPLPLGMLACAGLVPLLVVLSPVTSMWRGLRYGYVTFLTFHVITLNWTGGYAHANDPYMMLAGAVTMLVHPLFYILPTGVYLWVKKHLGEPAALWMLPFAWVAYEYSHSLSEWSFPWLTLGNTQSYELARMQFIEYTGILGLSFWLLTMNVLLYLLLKALMERRFSLRDRRPAGLVVLAGAVYLLPLIHGWAVLRGVEGTVAVRGDSLTVGIVQANIDPWEKWSSAPASPVKQHLALTDSLLQRTDVPRPSLVLWPETALPYYVFMPERGNDLAPVRTLVEARNVSVLTGLPVAVVYADSTRAPRSARRLRWTGERYDAFNAAALVRPGRSDVPWYGKMKMVPFAERVPYADLFAFMDFLRWGVGIGGWQIGRDTTVFFEPETGAAFSGVICYESVYPAFVAEFVRRGAEFLTILTVDSWWDHMSGAYQHQRFAVFRAVENRRWVARCAAGGISCYVDPWGRVMDETALFTRATLSRTLERRRDLTVYTRYGDWCGVACVFMTGLFVAAAAGTVFQKRLRSVSA